MVLRILRLIVRAVACLMVTTVLTPIAVAVTVLAAFLYLPLPATLPEPKPISGSLASTVLDKDGNPIATFREFEQNLPVSPTDIPLVLKEAVISSEDKNFYHHGGVDIRGTVRAIVADIRSGRAVQGGSTITQQYVKNAYTGKQRTIVRKIREAVLASQLDHQTSKNDILFKYLSSIYLGEGSYGVGAASENYFSKPVNQLTLSEAALLAGIIPAPSSYEPRNYPQLAEARRETVLGKMLAQGYINQQQYTDAMAQRVTEQCKLFTPETCIFPPKQDPTKYPYFVDYVRRYLIQALGPAEVYGGGLTIQTTLDPALQDLAEKKVAEALANQGPPLDMSLVAVEPPTGFVKALVGGRDFAKSQVNEALGGCPVEPNPATSNIEVTATCWSGTTVAGGGTGRQPGSAFKPFTLATAFSKGVSPNKTYLALNAYQKGSYVMHNAADGEGGGGPVTLRQATWQSINTVFGQLINDVGVKDTAAMAKKLGITSAWESPKYHGLSYTLGVMDVSPLDMASAYGVFACDGRRYDPTPIVKVIDATGKTLVNNLARGNCGGDQVIDPAVATNVTDVLRGVITNGTASPRANIGRPAAGKTGTTDNYVNAWFVGYTPTLSTAIWLGQSTGQDPAKNSMRNLRAFGTTFPQVFGGGIPAQTWHNFMLDALANVPVTDFNQAAPIQKVADAINKAARAGIDPGNRLTPGGTGEGGPYEVPTPPPVAQPPETTTTSTVVSPGGGGGGGGPPTTTGVTLPGG